MDDPEGKVTYLKKYFVFSDGRATYRLWCIRYTLRFYLCREHYTAKSKAFEVFSETGQIIVLRLHVIGYICILSKDC